MLAEVFATDDVILIDSFAPFVFLGADAGRLWAHGFARHVRGLTGLRHGFGTAQEFGRNGGTVFFSQPITWEGARDGVSFIETGGLVVVLARQADGWRIRNSAWAVISYAETPR